MVNCNLYCTYTILTCVIYIMLITAYTLMEGNGLYTQISVRDPHHCQYAYCSNIWFIQCVTYCLTGKWRYKVQKLHLHLDCAFNNASYRNMAQTSAVSKIISGYRLRYRQIHFRKMWVILWVMHFYDLLCTYTNLRYTVPTYLVVHRHFQVQCVDTMTFVILHYWYII